VQWLENQGVYPYTHRHICNMPGVLNAQAGDFDRDGDIDVVAVSLLAESVNDRLSKFNTSSVVLLTQTSPGTFERTQVEGRTHQHISVEVGDFDGDGLSDFAVGNFLRSRGADLPDVTLWMNHSTAR
ncbi:MAG: FG-GAP repeat domain-containing protein, partial [Rubripirellula sp.]